MTGTVERTPLLQPVTMAASTKGATSLTSISNILNTLIGTGALALPHAFSSGGLVPGILTVLWCGLTGFFGLHLLTLLAPFCPPRQLSFHQLSLLTYPKLSSLFSFAIALKCFGVSISYLLILGALVPRLLTNEHSDPWLRDRRTWILVAMMVLTPISFARKLKSFRFISYIAILAVIDLLFLVAFRYFVPSPNMPEPGPFHAFRFPLGSDYVKSLPVCVFAFTCAQNVGAVVNELRNNTQRRVNVVVGSAVGTACVIYLIIGTLGYLTFGAHVSSNIISSYPPSHILIPISQGAIITLVLFSYPLQLHPCRAALHEVVASISAAIKGRHPGAAHAEDAGYQVAATDDVEASTQELGAHGEPEKEIPLFPFVAETCGILLTTFLVAIKVEDLSVVLGFVGATGSTTISFLLPALFYLALHNQPPPATASDPSAAETLAQPRKKWIARCAAALLVWGFAVMVTALYLHISDLIKHVKS